MPNLNWLIARLTQAKQKSPLWREFSEALTKVFGDHYEPLLERLKGLSSITTHHIEDLDIRIAELGALFDYESRVEPEDRALAVVYRLDEIHQKNSAFNINAALSRDFGGLDIEWLPLYAPNTGVAYGDDFRTAKELEDNGLDINDWNMTSRGVLNANLADVFNLGYTREKFVELLRKKGRFLVPTHGVYVVERLHLIYVMEWEGFTTGVAGVRTTVSSKPMENPLDLIMGHSEKIKSTRAFYTPKPKSSDVGIDDMPIDSYSVDAEFRSWELRTGLGRYVDLKGWVPSSGDFEIYFEFRLDAQTNSAMELLQLGGVLFRLANRNTIRLYSDVKYISSDFSLGRDITGEWTAVRLRGSTDHNEIEMTINGQSVVRVLNIPFNFSSRTEYFIGHYFTDYTVFNGAIRNVTCWESGHSNSGGDMAMRFPLDDGYRADGVVTDVMGRITNAELIGNEKFCWADLSRLNHSHHSKYVYFTDFTDWRDEESFNRSITYVNDIELKPNESASGGVMLSLGNNASNEGFWVDFSSANMIDTFQAVNCTLEVSDDTLKVRATGLDARVLVPAGFDSDEFPYLMLRYRRLKGTSSEGHLVAFWQNDFGGISEARSAKLNHLTLSHPKSIASQPDSAGWVEVTLDLRDEPNWAGGGSVDWIRFDLGFNASDLEFEVDYIRFVNPRASNGLNWRVHQSPLPFDPDQLYSVEARVRKVSKADHTKLYLGVTGFDLSMNLNNRYGEDTGGSQGYMAASGLNPVDDKWHIYTGYFKGRAAEGVSGSYGNCFTPETAGKLHADTAFISPIFVTGYSTSTSTVPSGWELDYIFIKKID